MWESCDHHMTTPHLSCTASSSGSCCTVWLIKSDSVSVLSLLYDTWLVLLLKHLFYQFTEGGGEGEEEGGKRGREGGRGRRGGREEERERWWQGIKMQLLTREHSIPSFSRSYSTGDESWSVDGITDERSIHTTSSECRGMRGWEWDQVTYRLTALPLWHFCLPSPRWAPNGNSHFLLHMPQFLVRGSIC